MLRRLLFPKNESEHDAVPVYKHKDYDQGVGKKASAIVTPPISGDLLEAAKVWGRTSVAWHTSNSLGETETMFLSQKFPSSIGVTGESDAY